MKKGIKEIFIGINDRIFSTTTNFYTAFLTHFLINVLLSYLRQLSAPSETSLAATSEDPLMSSSLALSEIPW